MAQENFQGKNAGGKQIFIPPVLAGLKMDAQTQKTIRAGHAVFKEGWTNGKGEKFDAFVYYDDRNSSLRFSKDDPFKNRYKENYGKEFEQILQEGIREDNFYNVHSEIVAQSRKPELTEVQILVIDKYLQKDIINEKFEQDICRLLKDDILGPGKDIHTFSDIREEADRIRKFTERMQMIDNTRQEKPNQEKFKYPSFEDYKSAVPDLHVAESLGYQLDEKSTSLRLQLKDSTGDIVLLSRDGALYRNQKNESDKGSVVDFVKNRLDQFPVARGAKDWTEGVNKILSGFMGVAYDFDEVHKKWGMKEPKAFNPAEHPAKPAKAENLNYLIQERNLSVDTVKKFEPFIHWVGNPNNHYKNIGFPYTIPGEDKIRGYELRNYGTKETGGFKGFSAGGDKVNAVWLATFAPDKVDVKHIFFAESAIDAMSFFELNRHKLNMKESAFVSTGGAVAQNQINNVMKEFPSARLHGCFDRDRAGHLYDITLACMAQKQPLSKVLTTDGVQFSVRNRAFTLKNEDISLKNFEEKAGFKSSVVVHKPSIGKDFNEMLVAKNQLNPVVKPKL
jgi:hypothetical protein